MNGFLSAGVITVELVSYSLHVYTRINKNKINHVDNSSQFHIHDASLLGGFNRGDLVLVAGYPGTGKSTWLHSLTTRIAVQENIPVLAWKGESGGLPVVVNFWRIFGDSPFCNHTIPIWHIADSMIYTTSDLNAMVSDIRNNADLLKSEHGIAALSIDYLQLLRPSGKTSNRKKELADILKHLKQIAIEFNVPVIVLFQQINLPGRPQFDSLRIQGGVCRSVDNIVILCPVATHQDCNNNPAIK